MTTQEDTNRRINQLRSQISIIDARLNALYQGQDNIGNKLKITYDERDLHKLEVELQSLTTEEQ